MAKKAVLTGINRYKYISHLRGCVNDVQNVRRLLVDVFDFPENNIHVLTDSSVTKERVLAEWKWLLKNAKPGDNLVFHFSGHGSYVKDLDGDEDDGVDELLCLYDMDFSDPDTYLLDDDMRKLTEQVPEGVYLTVILDQCHSGTATRLLISPEEGSRSFTAETAPLVDELVTRRRSKETGFRSLLLSELPEQERVLARFVEPPPGVLPTGRNLHVQSRIARDSIEHDGSMNHVLWAASRANQTAADAYIDGDYHGAFTYHFCKAVRQVGPHVEHRDLYQAVRTALERAQFTQEPQLEPHSVRGPLFRWNGTSASGGGHATSSSGNQDVALSSPEAQSLLSELRDVLREIRDSMRGTDTYRDSSRAGTRALVYVHGICQHDDDYAEPWWQALRPHLSSELQQELDRNRHAVLWSDLVNRSRSAGLVGFAPNLGAEERELAEKIKEVLQDRVERQAVEVLPHVAAHEQPRDLRMPAERSLFEVPGLTCIDDFVRYLLHDATRAAIQKRFMDTVRPLLRSGATIDVISHSWGTVVAYESLRQLDSESFPGRVNTLFTVGAALAIRLVRWQVRPDDGQRPRHVRRWVNLNATGDIVGGPLTGFRVDHEFINLPAEACWPNVNAKCAHSSYFKPSNIAVNRDIFARFIEQ